MAIGLGAILGGIGTIGSALGIGRKAGQPARASGQSYSGYYALPPEAQAAYQNFLNLVNQYSSNPYDSGRYAKAINPNSDPYQSSELYELQKLNPSQNVRPVGVLEPFNAIQKSAIESYANPDYSLGGLAQYYNPFQEQVIDRAFNAINRSSDIARSNLLDRLNSRGGILKNSATDTQLALQEEARSRALADAAANLGAQGFREAVGLRGQSLSDMLNAGNLVQRQQQAQLQSAMPSVAAQYNPYYGQAMALGNLLSLFPAGSSSTSTSFGERPASTNMLGKGLGLAGSLFGNQFGGLFG